MEQRERMFLEAVVGVLLVLFLVLGSVVVINASEGTEIEIKDSYNTYNTYVTNDLAKPHVVDYVNYQKAYYVNKDLRYENEKDQDTRLRYYHVADQRVFTGVFGNDVNDYEVYVKNPEFTGGNFKVVYYFEDAYGNTQSYAVNNYVPARGEKRFFMRDAMHEHKYDNWYYTIESTTSRPRHYYSN